PAGGYLLVTHLHPDHVGGRVGETSVALPNAEMVVGTQDHSFFTSEEMKAQAPDGFKPFFDMAVAAAGQFGERVTLIDGEASIAPGITAMPLPGHTPGHMGFMLESGGEQLLIWGDILHVPAVQFARPDVTLAFDADPDTARASRTKVLDMVATDKLMVAGMHMSFPGLGYVERASEGYRLVPAPWDYT
ncbi:MAG: MBL fold metallo-hydrolase, partial [Pseudomonadota bacterium]